MAVYIEKKETIWKYYNENHFELLEIQIWSLFADKLLLSADKFHCKIKSKFSNYSLQLFLNVRLSSNCFYLESASLPEIDSDS